MSNEKLNTKRFKGNAVFFLAISILIIQVSPVIAHNTSWNKATVRIKKNRLALSLRMDQNDLLGVVSSVPDNIKAFGHDKWTQLLPEIRSYIFKNLILEINSLPLTNVVDDHWHLDHEELSDHDGAHDHIGIIEISRTWLISDSLKSLGIKFDLLGHIEIPVKWVVVIFSDDIPGTKPYQVIDRGQWVSYDFTQCTWVDSLGKSLSSSEESTLWSKLVQFLKIGFNHISLEQVFQSADNPKVFLLYLLMAILIGVLHSLSPGHGKALIGAYIIDAKGTVTDAVILGLVTAFSHTISVLILGIILLVAFDAVVPEDTASYLNAISGLIIIIIGIYLFTRRLGEMKQVNQVHREQSSTRHSHNHQHITMESIQKKGIWTNVMLGVSGGMVPCPTALVVLFLAISLNQLVTGLMLIIFFSFGLAVTLTTLGVLFTKGSKIIDRYDNNRVVEKLPVFSAGIIVIIGTAVLIRALVNLI